MLKSRFETDFPAPSHAATKAPDPATTPDDGAAGFMESVRELSSPMAAPTVRSDISAHARRRQETPSAPVPDNTPPADSPASKPPVHDMPEGRDHFVSTPPPPASPLAFADPSVSGSRLSHMPAPRSHPPQAPVEERPVPSDPSVEPRKPTLAAPSWKAAAMPRPAPEASESEERPRRIRVPSAATRASAASPRAEVESGVHQPGIQPLNPESGARRLASPERPRSVESPPSSPTIEITIGRIEVQAVFAPTAASPPPRREVAGLSLEDYLERRQGNGR